MKLVLVILACLATAASAPGQTQPGTGEVQDGIPFELNREFGTIVLSVRINGHSASMVVDTGSNRTIVSSEVLRDQPDVKLQDSPLRGSGLVGSGTWSKATFEVGALTWSHRKVLVMSDFPEISRNMKQKIDGILGEDILREFDVMSIDFKHRRLLLLHCGDRCDPCATSSASVKP